jgi:2-polyprenyl-6-methoxyphenol hydroxylase-like FAD-dependent oxidoreductase
VTPNNERGYDVVVVGARAAGAATALLLARAGRRVLVVDRSSYGADTISTHGLMRAGVLQLQRWGLLDSVIAAGTPAIRRTTVSYGSDSDVVITIKPTFGVDALYAPRHTVLDPILVDAAVAAGAEIRYGITVTDVSREPDGRVTGIVGHDVDGGVVAFGAAIVVGADGVRSTIARRVDAPIERVGTGATGIVYGYWSGLETEGYEWVYTPRAVAGVIPTNDGQTCIFAGGKPARIGRGGIEVLRELLEQASPALACRLAGATAPRAVRRFDGPPGLLRRCWGPGWALVGDAGYWTDPIGNHGITDALRDAELLARAIVATDDGGQDRADALAEYQATRDRLSVDLFDNVDSIARYDWTEDEVADLLLRINSAMADEVELLATLDAVRVP